MKIQWGFAFLTLLLLWALVSQVNHYLAVWHLYVFAGALFVTFSALRLPIRTGMTVTLLGGLLCDANSAAPFGSHLLLFAVAHALITKVQHRIPADQTVTQVFIALITNLALYLALTIIITAHQPVVGNMWPRLMLDLITSQLFIVLIGPWFFALQTRFIPLDRFAARERY